MPIMPPPVRCHVTKANVATTAIATVTITQTGTVFRKLLFMS